MSFKSLLEMKSGYLHTEELIRRNTDKAPGNNEHVAIHWYQALTFSQAPLHQVLQTLRFTLLIKLRIFVLGGSTVPEARCPIIPEQVSVFYFFTFTKRYAVWLSVSLHLHRKRGQWYLLLWKMISSIIQDPDICLFKPIQWLFLQQNMQSSSTMPRL